MGQKKSEEEAGIENRIIDPLCDWFAQGHREMYWRSHPLPYYVWISEIMLQQTRVEAVRAYFDRFIQVLPSVEDLARVDDDRLMKLWEGLGYYNRARNLKKAAAVIVEEYGGEMPSEYEQLLALPGIGEYTAGAISSIAFGKPEPCVDGNVLRVWMRITDSGDDILKASVRQKVRQRLKCVMPKQNPSIFNQALMELGACVCVPNGLPKCDKCPLKDLCAAQKKGIGQNLTYAQSIPYKTPKRARKKEERTVLIFVWNGKLSVRRRNDQGLLAKMWEFPNLLGTLKRKEIVLLLDEAGVRFSSVKFLGRAKHIFSHIEWHMNGYMVELCENDSDCGKCKEQSIWAAQGFVAEEGLYDVDIGVKPLLKELLQGCVFELPEILKEKYSLPSAFEVYKKQVL